jgi:hypothetical protein
LIFGRKPADDFRYLWYRVNRHPKKGFLVFGLCHGKLVGHPIAQLRVVRTVYDAERYCRCGDDKILYPSNFGSGDFGRPKGALDGLGLFFVVDGTRSTSFSREQQARILRVVVAGLARFIAGSVRLNSASTRQPRRFVGCRTNSKAIAAPLVLRQLGLTFSMGTRHEKNDF